MTPNGGETSATVQRGHAMRAGRKPSSQSRAKEFRQRLSAWKRMPETSRPSLRAMATEIGTSHQLLSFYLRRWDKWQAKEYRRRADDLRARAEAEGRYLNQWEEGQVAAYQRAAFHSMLDSVLAEAVPAMLIRLKADAKTGKLSRQQLKVLGSLARQGFSAAQKILQGYSGGATADRAKPVKNNLPVVRVVFPKSFRSEPVRLATPLKRSLAPGTESQRDHLKIQDEEDKKMPSREASLRNLKKARAHWKRPRPWRSYAEQRQIRMITWHWLLGHGPWCSGRALAEWLGVSHTHVQKLSRTLPRDESAFLRDVECYGVPSTDALKRAREESRRERDWGLLRTQPRWKWVEFKLGQSTARDCVATKPNAATQVAQDPSVTIAPRSSKTDDLNYSAIHMWHLSMEHARSHISQPVRLRWRPGCVR